MSDYKDGTATVTQRNRFFDGDEIEIMRPRMPFITQRVEGMRDEDGNAISVANHAEQIVKIKTAEPVPVGSMLRKKR